MKRWKNAMNGQRMVWRALTSMIIRRQIRICKTNVRIDLMIALFGSSICGLYFFISIYGWLCMLYRCQEESGECDVSLGWLVKYGIWSCDVSSYGKLSTNTVFSQFMQVVSKVEVYYQELVQVQQMDIHFSNNLVSISIRLWSCRLIIKPTKYY